MLRNPMQDIVPKGNRSIRSVPVSVRKIKTTELKETVKEKTLKKDIEMKVEAEKNLEEDIQTEMQEIESLQQQRTQKEAIRTAKKEFEEDRFRRTNRSFKLPNLSGCRLMYIIGGVIAVIILASIVSSALHSAIVTITPHTAIAGLNGDFIAKKLPAVGELGYQSITLQQVASETVRATGQKQVSTRATGVITVFNNYSSTSQRLIKNTRFATPEGLIFRIVDSVTVPGKKTTVPGSVDANIIADVAGADYNVGLKDFTIPGFKGDPRYATFYARSKTSITGGFVGMQKIVSETDRTKAKSNIETKLRDDLTKQIIARRSANTIIYDKAYTIDFKALPDESVSTDQVTIKEQGTLIASAFDRTQLSSALARALLPGYKGDAINVPTVDTFAFTPKDVRPVNPDQISFHIVGNAAFEWIYDETALKNALKGQARSNTPTVLQKFPMIEKADISIRPFWSSSFPSSVDKIQVKKAI